jgi:hypothetical protein
MHRSTFVATHAFTADAHQAKIIVSTGLTRGRKHESQRREIR